MWYLRLQVIFTFLLILLLKLFELVLTAPLRHTTENKLMPSIYPSQVICVLQLLSRSKVVYSLLLQKGYEMICKRTKAFCILERWTLFWIWPNMRKMVGFIGRLRCIIPGSGIYMYVLQSPIIDFLSNHFCTWWEKLWKLLRFSNKLQLALVYVTRRPTTIQYKLLVLLIKVI